MKVKIIDPAHACSGQELEGGIIYLDYYHRGGRPDLYEVRSPAGKTYRLLTHQIDEAHYEAQEISEEVERLGANVGDTVLIIHSGSGGCNRDFDWKAPHVITKIDGSGHVEFDHSAAFGFRPDVQLLSKAELEKKD
ncbi:hypothetical protein H1230_30205 [Paenibacillus sp. 19GGS1-52]|uniref:hypothetical protein n=1 Tax=Paenibacillus sp. 19GGS1-52 TaxID=2758563 RepID=UPI001EFB87D5|nr:hypothetical protein [Paenibacillus sp. 19GGS1-52]ULO07162.1 hypothetical protein H1230_30205 [Paenibacillus sp. 19GGS1-52]